MQMLKPLVIAAVMTGTATLALAQGPGIDTESHNLPPQRTAPTMGMAPSAGGHIGYRHSTRRHHGRTYYNTMNGDPAVNAAASGSSGTHKGAQKTGSAANTEKVIHNQSGYR